ncbi:MAG TPA: TIGR03032 family protein [Planctomycetaceae bacterium]|nr:TIGR03032 family protein [Planctomycetaceae bacterium]
MQATATDPEAGPNSSDVDSSCESPLRSKHTASLAEVLNALGSSLLVSTYQAGKLIFLRAERDRLNTHFRPFNKPMGIAVGRNRIAIGGALDIWEFHNVPAAASQAEGERAADSCFLPRHSTVTGDIQIHEMEWGRKPNSVSVDSLPGRAVSSADSELWFVNTRFSCLCTRSDQYSFVPRWRPPFISTYTPEDRCHLNGLAMEGGVPRFVTALGESDAPAGWRENKASGGIVMDVPSSEVIARGLSMPHSPRLYGGQLWVLNSGQGGLGFIDSGTGKYQEVCRLPGFTRGLSFHGRYAFVGLSQVRESAYFSGIEISEVPEHERWSGVAVVDIVAGECIAWLRFEGAVQEVFAVSVLPDQQWPDLINEDRDCIANAFVLPDDSLQAVPAGWRDTSGHAEPPLQSAPNTLLRHNQANA